MLTVHKNEISSLAENFAKLTISIGSKEVKEIMAE